VWFFRAQEALAPKLFEKLSTFSAISSIDEERTVGVTSDGGGELTRRMVVREPGVEHPWTHNAGPVLRIGNKGSGHQAHYDLKHNVFLQLTGRKSFTLYVPTLLQSLPQVYRIAAANTAAILLGCLAAPCSALQRLAAPCSALQRLAASCGMHPPE
jgi:hypothetical protein